MPKTKRINTDVKKKFVEAMRANGNNRTQAYLDVMHTTKSREWANIAGPALFKDPEVQELYKASGVNLDYLSKRTKELMDSPNENIASQHIKQFNQALLKMGPTETRKLNINLFGDLTYAQVERIRQGRKALSPDPGTGEDQPE